MWSHKKHGKKNFTGTYSFQKVKRPYPYQERIFQLVCGDKIISFESWQAAKKMGWIKK